MKDKFLIALLEHYAFYLMGVTGGLAFLLV